MQNNYNKNRILDVNTAKVFINLGYSRLDRINGSYLYRTMLTESVDKLRKLELLIKDKAKFEYLIKQAEEAIADNLACLSNPRTSILQEFGSVDELSNCYIKFCEEMTISQTGLYYAREKIESFLKTFENDLNRISNELINFENSKIQLLLLQQQLSEISEENLVLKKTISILSK